MAAAMATIHRVLAVMTTLMVGGATALAVAGRVPLSFLGEIDRPEFIGRTFAIIEVVLLGAALLILGRRVPRRERTQPIEEYWAVAGRRATLLWFVLEITAAFGAFAFVLTGDRAPILVGVVALVALVRLSPSRFAGG